MTRRMRFAGSGMRLLIAGAIGLVLAAADHASAQSGSRSQADANDSRGDSSPESHIDFDKARGLLQRRQRGETLTAEEQAYLQRAIAARQGNNRGAPANAPSRAVVVPRESTGLIPLTEMTASDRYHEQDGGLYGAGRNTPPPALETAARSELQQIVPRDREGRPASDGRIVFVSISMSNATQEFSRFQQMAERDPERSRQTIVVDCAQGGQAMAEWTSATARPWQVAEERLQKAGVTPQQVQVAWIKLANKGPQGSLEQHGRKLESDTLQVLQNARRKFPNLRIVYLGSRIYAGYATTPLNPEPYAYESAFVARWLIERQMRGDSELNWDAGRGEVKSPLLLWGPYLWGDGEKPRAADQLVWLREDLAGDGTHPSDSGRNKVAKLLLDFCHENPLAKPWYLDHTPAAAR